jgi:hypothetical protein
MKLISLSSTGFAIGCALFLKEQIYMLNQEFTITPPGPAKQLLFFCCTQKGKAKGGLSSRTEHKRSLSCRISRSETSRQSKPQDFSLTLEMTKDTRNDKREVLELTKRNEKINTKAPHEAPWCVYNLFTS